MEVVLNADGRVDICQLEDLPSSSHFEAQTFGFQCEQCQKVYRSKQGLDYHMHTFHEDQSDWLCPFCTKEFKRKDYLTQHLLSKAHLTLQPLKCLACEDTPVRFTQSSSLNSHFNRFHLKTAIMFKVADQNDALSVFVCVPCGNIFKSKPECWSHFKIHHVHEASLLCPTCEIEFNSSSDYKKHLDFHINAASSESFRPGAYICDICSGSFSHNQELADHLSEDHLTRRFTFCFKCGTCFTQLQTFHDHSGACLGQLDATNHYIKGQMEFFSQQGEFVSSIYQQKPAINLEDSDVEEAKYQCQPCDESFSTASRLVEHCKTTHCSEWSSTPANQPNFACSECGKSFDLIRKLEQHMKTHQISLVPSHVCGLCSISFPKKPQLAAHIRTVHAPDMPFVCHKCPKRCLTSAQLRRHLRVHSRRYACGACGGRFAQKCELERHLLVHTDLKPHKCFYCDATFRQMQSLKKHIKTKHVVPTLEHAVPQIHEGDLVARLIPHQLTVDIQ